MDGLSMSYPSAKGKRDRSRLENELCANLVRRACMARVVEPLCVKGKTERGLDARTKRLGVT